MGKRKSSKKPVAKVKAAPLDKSFRCVFCQHFGTITVKMNKSNMTGRLDCKDCSQTFVADINHLAEPIDVYSEWIDNCEEVNKRDADGKLLIDNDMLEAIQRPDTSQKKTKKAKVQKEAPKTKKRARDPMIDDDDEDEEQEYGQEQSYSRLSKRRHTTEVDLLDDDDF